MDRWKKLLASKKTRMQNQYRELANYERRSPGPYRKSLKRTKPEKMMMKLLDELTLDYVAEFPVSYGGGWKVFDFLVEGKMVVEVDGDYVHGNVDLVNINYAHLKTKKNDLSKSWIAKERGFVMLRFWASELERDPEFVKKTITENL